MPCASPSRSAEGPSSLVRLNFQQPQPLVSAPAFAVERPSGATQGCKMASLASVSLRCISLVANCGTKSDHTHPANLPFTYISFLNEITPTGPITQRAGHSYLKGFEPAGLNRVVFFAVLPHVYTCCRRSDDMVATDGNIPLSLTIFR